MATQPSDNVNEVIVAILPFADYSHLNQLFILARLIASKVVPVHFLCLADLNQSLKLRVQDGPEASNIHFDNLLVPAEEAIDGVPSIKMLMKKLSEPIHRTCLELSTNAKKLVIIHDTAMKNVIGDVHSLIPNIESYMFIAGSAITRYSYIRESIDWIVDDDDDHDEMMKQMQDEFPRVESCFPPSMPGFIRAEHEWKFHSGEIMNSCREVEGKYLHLLANAKDKKPLWNVGPLHMLLQQDSICCTTRRHECLEFLDRQDSNSVIFVSFGTTTTFSQDQVNELALGLEQSNHRFIWVLRNAKKIEKNDGKHIELPKGFEERVKGRGMVVRTLAPQLEILGHPSTGGFLTHCGWNSCMESISMGVPLATWPIMYDQPYNAILVTNMLKIGTSVKSWARWEELVTAETIEKAVKTLMGTTQGEEMRKKVMELSNKMKSSVSGGGLACKEIESFISRIIN